MTLLLANLFFRSAETFGESQPVDVIDIRRGLAAAAAGAGAAARPFLAHHFQFVMNQFLELAANFFEVLPQALLHVE